MARTTGLNRFTDARPSVRLQNRRGPKVDYSFKDERFGGASDCCSLPSSKQDLQKTGQPRGEIVACVGEVLAFAFISAAAVMALHQAIQAVVRLLNLAI